MGWVVTGRTSILSHAEQKGNTLQQEESQSILDHAELLMSRRTLQLVKCMERSTQNGGDDEITPTKRTSNNITGHHMETISLVMQ